MKKRQQMQKAPKSAFQRAITICQNLSEGERVTLIKALSGSLKQRLFTENEVRDIVDKAVSHALQRAPLMQGLREYQQGLHDLRGGLK